MADAKTTALTELTAFDGDEEFYVVDDDDGTPVSKRVTIENLTAEVTDGIATAISDGDASTLTSAQSYADGKVSDTAYNAGTWDAVTGVAPSKNAVRDKVEALDTAKANLASPTFTGTVTLPSDQALPGNPTTTTQAQGNSSTRVATTAYVQTEVGLLVPKSLFDANTMLYATTDNTPAALTVGASTFVGRKATGDISAMSVTEAGNLLGVYTAYTPSIKGGATTVTTSAMTARYCQIGKRVHAYGKATVSSAGASNGVITVGLPVNAQSTITFFPCGTGAIDDASPGNYYRALVAHIDNANRVRFYSAAGLASGGNPVGVDPAFTLASGDEINWDLHYESA